MRALKLITVGLSCVAATAAFILSCGGGPKSASAQSCSKWEVSIVSVAATGSNCAGNFPTYPSTCALPGGLEPIGMVDSFNVLGRRCAP
jgi:hypothetical protein